MAIGTKAYLEDLATKVKWEFFLNPSDQGYTYTQDLGVLVVPGKPGATQVYKGSTQSLRLSITLWKPGGDFRKEIKALEALTKAVPGTVDSPNVRYVFGATEVPRAKVASVDIQVLSSPGGIPDRATGTITLQVSEALAPPLTEKILTTKDGKVNTSLSPREQDEGKKKILDRMLKDKGYQKKLGINLNTQVFVGTDGKVTTGGAGPGNVIGTLDEVLKR
jgi:hypothetical protein